MPFPAIADAMAWRRTACPGQAVPWRPATTPKKKKTKNKKRDRKNKKENKKKKKNKKKTKKKNKKKKKKKNDPPRQADQRMRPNRLGHPYPVRF